MFSDATCEHVFEGGGGRVDLLDLSEAEFFERDKMFARPEHCVSGDGRDGCFRDGNKIKKRAADPHHGGVG